MTTQLQVETTLSTGGLEIRNRWAATIALVTYGHVWVAKEIVFDGQFYYLFNTRTITSWGSEKGLNELIAGPTKNTDLSALAPTIILLPEALLALIPVKDSAWEKHLK